MELAHKQIYRPAVMNAQLQCVSGCLWITVDGSSEDVILEPGQSFTTKQKDRVLVYGLQHSDLRVFPIAP